MGLSYASAWRGRWSDVSGLYCLGVRYYDPVAGRFLGADPLGHAADPSLYGFCGGDPINGFDADGRLGKAANPVSEFLQGGFQHFQDQMDTLNYEQHFTDTQQGQAAFQNNVVNFATLGLYNTMNVAFYGEDIQGQFVSGAEQTLARVELGLMAASMVPWGRVLGLGAEALGLMERASTRVGAFLNETAPILNPANYRYDPASLYGASRCRVSREQPQRRPRCCFGGVPNNGSPRAVLANQGVAIPRGTALDEASLIKHVLGEDVNAGVTSWSPLRDKARQFSGLDGTIIEVNWSRVSDQVVPRPNVQKYESEIEVLLRGTVQGRPTRP